MSNLVVEMKATIEMQISYLFDPLCGWCYGATPALEQLARLDGVSLTLAPTGLFAGEGARVMDQRFAAYAWENDQRIARLTGLPFSEAYRDQVLAKTGGLFDSAPATLGLTAVHLSKPRKEIESLKALQTARYVDGRDNSDLTVVIEILARIGLSEAADRLREPDDQLLASYRQRLKAAREDMREFHLQGVPTLIIQDGNVRRHLTTNHLFGNFSELAAALQGT